jgi:hypothetical protein
VPQSHALLAGLFDYAGAFPPASLSLGETMRNYARYRTSRHGWMLGRLIVPAAALDECSTLGATHFPRGDGAVSWRISALCGADLQTDAAQVSAFNRQHADAEHGAAIVDTVEARVTTPDEVRAARVWASRGFEVYCEVAADEAMPRLLDAIARAGLHAKVRTGGVDADTIPSCAQVSSFLCGCVERGVVAKATAGLHHVVTGEYPLTYTPDAPRATMFGFLNVVLGAGIAEGAGRAAVQSVEVGAAVAHLLSLRTTPSWRGHTAMEWRGTNGPVIEGPLDHFAVSGRALIRSVGTCSFEEPVEEARRIGLVS